MPKKVWKTQIKNHRRQWKYILVEISSRNIYSAMLESTSFSSLKHCIWEKERGEDSHLVQIFMPGVANN